MTTWGWQDGAAIVLAGLALAYLARRTWRLWLPRAGGGSGCTSGCGACPASKSGGPSPQANGRATGIVLIESLGPAPPARPKGGR